MKKAIGGLLVASMLTTPNPVDLNYIAYLALKSHNKVMYVQFIKEEETEATPADIDLAMSGMEENSRVITGLLKERTAVLKKLEAKMDLLSYSKVTLNDEQVAEYAGFVGRYKEDAQNLSNLLKTLDDGKNLRVAQKEILNEDTDYNLVVSQLDSIINTQHMAIGNLTQTIYEGKSLVEML